MIAREDKPTSQGKIFAFWAPMASTWLMMALEAGLGPSGLELLDKGVKANPDSWLIAFDAERKRSTARMVGAAAGRSLGHRISERAVSIGSALLFAGFGVAMLAGWF